MMGPRCQFIINFVEAREAGAMQRRAVVAPMLSSSRFRICTVMVVMLVPVCNI